LLNLYSVNAQMSREIIIRWYIVYSRSINKAMAI